MPTGIRSYFTGRASHKRKLFQCTDKPLADHTWDLMQKLEKTRLQR